MYAVSQLTDFRAPLGFIPPAALDSIGHHSAPDRFAAQARSQNWLAATLDEIDYGMLLLTDEGKAIQVNHAARTELDGSHPLQLVNDELRVRRAKDVRPFVDALQAAARRGLRKLLTLGEGAQRVSVSVVPLSSSGEEGEPVMLVMLGKRQVCGALAVQGFASGHRLTATESRVLAALCRGTPPTEIATELGIAISTVRTHIRSLRQKTGADGIRGLVQQVALLPPLMGVLRGVGGQAQVECNDVDLVAA